MINKKLCVLSIIFMIFAIAIYFYNYLHLEPVANRKTEYLNGFSEYKETKLQYNIDLVNPEEKGFFLYGWAIIQGKKPEEITVAVSVCNEKEEYIMTAEKNERTDVSETLEDSLYKNCGFVITFDLTGIPDGVYSTKLYLLDEKERTYCEEELSFQIHYHGGTCKLN